MPKRWILWPLVIASLVLVASPRGPAADKEKPRAAAAAVAVTVDTTEVPEVADWAAKAKKLVEKWHPLVAELLKSDGFTPPAKVHIVFKKEMKGIAFAQGTTITIAADWVKKRPDDLGMVIHEMTHIIQNYRRFHPGWLVEGIADYIRYFKFEPNKKITIDPRRASYKDGYGTTARFLDWAQTKYDKDLVRKLNAALRKGEYKEELFQTYTTKTLDQLWAAFIKSLREKKA